MIRAGKLQRPAVQSWVSEHDAGNSAFGRSNVGGRITGWADNASQRGNFRGAGQSQLILALRQISATAVPSSPCLMMNTFCVSENFDAFI